MSVTDIQIPGYDIKSEIGRGGMATVYLARQKSFGRDVALKIMAPVLSGDEGFTKRFLREGATVANLMHPNIIKVFDTGVHDNHYYLAMEYFPAGTLKQHIEQGLEAVDAIRIIKAILEALRYAHSQGLIHRDLKSQNILLYENGTPVVSDFGIVKIVGEKTMLTGTGLSVGSPQYMSPEQIKGGQAVDERSDLYSIGVLFFEMLTGHVPFDAEESFAVAFKHIYDPIPRLPSDLGAFQPFLARLLAKNPADRFPNAAEALAALAEIHYSPHLSDQGRTVVMPVQNRSSRTRSRPKQSSTIGKFFISAVILLLIAGGGYFYWQQQIAGEAQHQAGLQRQQQEQLEQQRQAELQRQQQEQLERQQQAELERQRQAEIERQRQQELERQQQAELERQRQAEIERQQQEQLERQRQAELERQRQAEIERQQQQELEQQRQAELERQRQAEIERQQQVTQLLDEARRAQQAGDLTLSLERIAVGLALMPESHELLALLEQVQQQLTNRRVQQEAAEQQRQAELDRQQQEEQQRQAELDRQQQEEQQRQAELDRQQQEEQQRQAELDRQQRIDILLTAANQQFNAGNYATSLQQLNELLSLQNSHTQAQQLKRTVQAAQEESRLGLSRSQRQTVQETLTDMGFNTRGVDGIFGANTRRAIEAFQKQKRLPITGYLNAAQFALLQSLTPQTTAATANAEEPKQDTQLPEITLVSPSRGSDSTAVKPETQQQTPPVTPAATPPQTTGSAPTEWQELDKRLASFKNTAEQYLRQARIRSAPPRRPAGVSVGCQGDCANGQGTYVFDTGDIYVGTWRDNDRHGQGVYFHGDGSVYEGSFSRNERNGTGAFYYASGDIYYGSWQGGSRHGRGIYYYTNGIKLYGDFSNGRLQGNTVAVFYNNGDVYVGQWRNDSKNGRGVYYESNGRKYAGEWRNNVKVKVVDLN